MNKTLKFFLNILIFLIFLITLSCGDDDITTRDSYVTITPKTVYYEVNIDYSTGDRYDIGKEYGAKVLEAVPNYEKELESLLSETVAGLHAQDKKITYETLVNRALEIAVNAQPRYMDEIDGFASILSGGTINILGDGKMSRDEFLMLNFLPDISTITSCSAVAAYGDRSITGHTILGRNTDWYPGSRGQLGYVNAVVYTKTGPTQVVSFGYLGMIGDLVAINSSGVFVANLYSDVGAPYSAKGKRSVLLDIREAIETSNTVDEVGSFLGDPSRIYAYHNNMYIADRNLAKVLENDFERNRALRVEDSQLNPGIEWNISDAIACVNGFVLKGNSSENFHKPGNEERWNNFIKLLMAEGGEVNSDGIKTIMSYHKQEGGGEDDGDIYWKWTVQSLIYSFSDNSLELWLHPPTGEFDGKPVFVAVPIPFLEK